MAETALTIENAPRELDKLQTSGRYRLRQLAEQLQLLPDEATKSAFMRNTPAQMAEAIHMALLTYDSKNGNGKANGHTNGHAAAPEPAPEPVREPVVQSAPTPAPAREPRTSKQAAASAAAATTDNAAVHALLKEQMVPGLNRLNTALDQLKETVAMQQAPLVDLTKIVASMNKQTQIMFSLVVMIAEEHLKGSRGQLLQDAIAQLNDLGQDVQFAEDRVAGK